MMNLVHLCQAPMFVNCPGRYPNGIVQTSRSPSFYCASNKNWGELRASERGDLLCDLNEPETMNNVEMERRRKIGLANKGKIPWNKGKKHKAETRELIKQRTIEALRDPKVRKLMSSYPHIHSEQRKEKIGIALKRLWEKRLSHKRLQESCILTWAATISEAAKMGSIGQQQLDWDSYEKIKVDIISNHLRWKMKKAKAKERAELKSKRKAELKAKRNAEVQSARKATISQQRRKKTQELSSLSCLKYKEKMAKVSKSRKKLKSSVAQVEEHKNQGEKAIDVDKWDLEFIHKEKMRKRISFAEQIQAAKNKHLETEKGNLTNHLVSLEHKQDT